MITGAASVLLGGGLAKVGTKGLAALEARAGGRLGVMAVDAATGRTLTYRADERFKLMSSFKGFLTAMMLHEAAAGRCSLTESVTVGESDLIPASPVTIAAFRAGRRSVTIGDLGAAAMARSDNTAANLLMRRLGGPPALTAFLRASGDDTTTIDHYEGPLLATGPISADSSTPRAVAQTVRTLLTGPTLSTAGRRQWSDWMESNVVGLSRLRAAFPSAWRAGDRTGTADGICNDYAYAFSPGDALLVVSAYYASPGASLSEQEQVIREVGGMVVNWRRSFSSRSH